MFHYLAHVKGQANALQRFSPDALPSITGKCDDKTVRAIRLFQQSHANRLLKLDGLIEPSQV
jgi:hypothetical protein